MRARTVRPKSAVQHPPPPIGNGRGYYDLIKWRRSDFDQELQEIFPFIILGGGANMKSVASFKREL